MNTDIKLSRFKLGIYELKKSVYKYPKIYIHKYKIYISYRSSISTSNNYEFASVSPCGWKEGLGSGNKNRIYQ